MARHYERIVLRKFPFMALLLSVAVFVVSCGDQSSVPDGGEAETTVAEQRYPDVLSAELEPSGGGYSLDVTISSPYDAPERYANGWRVLSPDGDVLGEHELLHDHAEEQPFTRTQTGLRIPDEVEEITVEGRDLENGYGGETVEVEVG